MTTKPVNIAAYLPKMAQSQPRTPAIIAPYGRSPAGRVLYEHYTYKQLDDKSNAIAAGLEKVGIKRGVRTVLMVKPSLDFFALTFALFKIGAVPVVVDPGLGLKSLKSCLGRAKPEAFIGIPPAHVARLLFGWSKDTIKTYVTVGRRWFWGGHTLDQVQELAASDAAYQMAETTGDEIAAILFTSGSTGPPKGVVYRHENFAAQVEMIRELFGIQPGEIDLPTFPLFALFDPALGMTTIVPDMDPTKPAKVDPAKIIEAIEDFGVNTMFGSPALLNTVGRYGEKHKVKLPTLKRVIAAGAPLPAHVMERFHTMLEDDGIIYPPYGATESLPVAVLGSHEILQDTWPLTEQGKGVCVGRPVPIVDVKVIGITDEGISKWDESLCVPQGEVGEIVVKGPVVTQAYFNDGENTGLAKIEDIDGIRHRMGDLGYFDTQGRLWFCGRKSHRVILSQQTLFTIPCEGIFNAHPDIYRTALVGAGSGDNRKPVLCIELEAASANADQSEILGALKKLAQKHSHTSGIETFLFHPSFPVDIRHNAKIGREKLSVWAAGQLG
ncbi:MAG: AMP-binding protein [Deltaproteobacteria bacterium]|jgi:olefin beta-lactone synthetase|nr:AMP-binding protein [Deltaproteobacteria bacterium]MBT6432484.1 AMP-binding protein [Deltaproteobacteria bacterium]MBT6490970.1 AMP-binding protein [Deltaproteobacteria bacterium]